MRVLVVDDEEELVFLLVDVYKRLGHEAIGMIPPLDDVKTAIESDAYDLVSIDNNMPGIRGCDTIQKYHQLLKAAWVLITGDPFLSDCRKLCTIAPHATVTKPFSSEAVREAIENALRIKREWSLK